MTRRALSPLFALLIFAAHLNCVVEHGFECAVTAESISQDSVQASNDGAAPVGPQGCEHDCICKGATLGTQVGFINYELPSFGLDYLATSSQLPPVQRVELDAPIRPQIPFCCSPLRGTERCAVLQSFLI